MATTADGALLIESRQSVGRWAWGNVLRFGVVWIEIALVVLLFKAVRLESEAFRRMLILAAMAFPLNHVLPLRFRLPFFVLVSGATIFTTLGAVSAAWLIGIGLVFIGLCHVPASMNVRLGLVVFAALILAVFRVGWVGTPWPGTVWPILGAMFMFRIIAYLYDLAHKSAPFSAWRALAYFFMTPNVCMPLFPVVDYQTFCRTYYNDDAYKIYQTGIKWMIRGATQLILYRFVYLFVTVDPAEVTGAAQFFQYMVATYLLYLQVSGLFHIAIGLLHLFGFNLPETNHQYLLASSFTDFWRRINIYWKDFMMKVFFYPLFFRLRKRGATQGMILATLVTFFATWFLHAYQWFWLRGAFLITLQDIIFWLVLGVLVTLSVWNESRSKKKPVAKTGLDSVRLAALLAAKTVFTFLTITLLWSLWTSDSVSAWLAMLMQLRHWNADAFVKIGLVLGALAASAIIAGRDQWKPVAGASRRTKKEHPFDFWRATSLNAATAVFVVAASLSALQSHLNPKVAAVLSSLENTSLNPRDAAILQRGYYEDLIQVDRFNTDLQALYNKRPKDYFQEWRAAMNVKRKDYLGVELARSAKITYAGATYTTNEWGMRDKPYPKEKPAGVYRIGLIGSSHTMGWGVTDALVCDTLAEDRLNAEGLPFELLNFSVNGYDPIQKELALEEKMLDFHLDAAFLICHRLEKAWIVSHLVQRIKAGTEITEPHIRELVAQANVTKDMSEAVLNIRLSSSGSELLKWSLKRFADVCRERGIRSAWVFMPEIGHVSISDADVKEIFACAKEAGFDTILDYSDAYKGHADGELVLSDIDDHPGAFAHSLLANRIYDTVKSNFVRPADNVTAQAKAAAGTLPR